MTARSVRAVALVALLGSAVHAPVPFSRLQSAAVEPGSWLTYSGTYAGHRFSELREITPANVQPLGTVNSADYGSITSLWFA
jgi:glucose dehydrogenase